MCGTTVLAATTLAVILALYAPSDAATSQKYTAMGNLQTVIHGESLFSTDIDENRKTTGVLWCQVREGTIHYKPTWARFVRIRDQKQFRADIGLDDDKAYLHFGQSKADASGKYRCEIKVPDNSIIIGNMFAYSHPVVKNNETWELKKSESEPFTVVGPAVYAPLDSAARIQCPIVGYPEPQIVWYKDKFPLEIEGRVKFTAGVLSIEGAQEEDAGVYRCEATNQFPVQIDGPEQHFAVKLDQELRIGDSYGWMLPLAIILIILLLLFLVIFTCQRCAKYKADQYNVADRERALHNDQVPLKNSV
ncbi:Ig-like domain-containing protein [Caenorhabditis elegans]|uniref:Ig-like domain-containing protein n=2 Tax=Caenorhabditis elegans TaxID=6239 RepID=Q9BPN5_CAEEL|nr:Ig-like domain-containing protein [Caenorhabditis elegans]CCD74303.1 Ig-like domain-containing protein [Caenorhabditis elegans]|eukprot:NP_503523.2 2 (Zwei) IG domain protein [Caenorhabditis elegans]